MRETDEEDLCINGQHFDNLANSKGLSNARINFYFEQAKENGDPVLELACGTGLITIPIAKEGMSVMGLDLSEISKI